MKVREVAMQSRMESTILFNLSARKPLVFDLSSNSYRLFRLFPGDPFHGISNWLQQSIDMFWWIPSWVAHPRHLMTIASMTAVASASSSESRTPLSSTRVCSSMESGKNCTWPVKKRTVAKCKQVSKRSGWRTEVNMCIYTYYVYRCFLEHGMRLNGAFVCFCGFHRCQHLPKQHKSLTGIPLKDSGSAHHKQHHETLLLSGCSEHIGFMKAVPLTFTNERFVVRFSCGKTGISPISPHISHTSQARSKLVSGFNPSEKY